MKSKHRRGVITWPIYFRLPVGLLVCIPLLIAAAVYSAAVDAISAFFDRDEWGQIAAIFVGIIIGDRD